MTNDALRTLIAGQLEKPVSAEAMAFAEMLSARPGAVAVLFYGARIRDETSEGPYDFYILTETDAAYHTGWLSRTANQILPPNVYHEKLNYNLSSVGAKVAVMSLAAFQARLRIDSRDTTIWARFCQPSRLIWSRDEISKQGVTDAIAESAKTAAWWAKRLAPDDAVNADDIWRGLFAATYGSELRVESGSDRSRSFIEAEADYFLELANILDLTNRPTGTERNASRARWQRRTILGKVRNAARLIKAAFTYSGGIDYALAKVERHSGRPVELTAWQRRWPLLAAPGVVWKLIRERRLR